jgi:hypothetical protein
MPSVLTASEKPLTSQTLNTQLGTDFLRFGVTYCYSFSRL